MQTTEIHELGCWLDNHRGHYISRDVIQLAQSFGFIVGQSDQWVIDCYEEQSHEENYPFEAIVELCDEAIEWLNHGRDNFPDARMAGQNWPPIKPEGTYWSFNDGDFGLYREDDLID